MAVVSIAVLKTYFETGDFPTEGQFVDLIDTLSTVSGVTVAQGGTGVASFTPYAVIAGGTTSTGALQTVSGVGTAGQVLTSNGAGTLPTWQAAATGWALTGNALTGTEHSPTEFFGSTNNFDVVFKENNVEIFRIYNGFVGFGTGATAPLAKIDIVDPGTNPALLSFSNTTWADRYRFYYENNTGLFSLNTSSWTPIRFNAATPSIVLNALITSATGTDASNATNVFQAYGTNFAVDGRFVVSGAGNVSIGKAGTPTARLELVGAGSTSVTYQIISQNSALAAHFAIRNDGAFYLLKGINTTGGDSAIINTTVGRFRKDTSGSTFTLTNALIDANSIILLSFASDPGIASNMFVVAGAGSAVITFQSVPLANTDVNFEVIN